MMNGIDNNNAKQSFSIYHNLPKNQTIEQVVQSFKDSETNRLHHRSSPVKLHHTIISFSNKDYPTITTAIAQDITKKYLQLRCKHSLAVAVAHQTDNAHYHIHIMQSGVELYTGKSNRISKEQFASIKKILQEYQLEKYPQLQHSIVAHGKRNKQRISEKEYQFTKRTKQPSKRELLKQTITQAYHYATSRESFFRQLQEQGLTIYQRNGKDQGVISDTIKIRFSNAGITEQQLSELDIVQDFEQLRKDQERNREMTIGR